jgi:hypothetical protein
MDRIEAWTPESPFLEMVETRERAPEGESLPNSEVTAPWATQSESPFS